MTTRYETVNSVYLVDTESMRYMRQPGMVIHGDDISERLLYDEWLPLAELPRLVADPFQHFTAPELRDRVLHIMHETSTIGIYTSRVLSVSEIEDATP